ncbi:hypothetical protein pb186bvf_012524 [Paramecium bursaria]
MSDKIRYILEKHIPDLLALQKRRIFSEEEVKDILQNREQFEYDLQRRTHGLKDYMKVLDYEYRLERQRRARALELGIKKFNNRDFTIVKRIINLWDRIMNKYRYRIDLWKQYLCFCYKINSKKQFFKVITNALRFNPFCIDIWIIGGIYEYEIAKNPFKARKIFYQGLRSNSNSKQLWCEYLKFELTFLDTLTNQEPKKEENGTFISFVQDDKPQFTYKPNLDGVKTIIQLSTENCSDISIYTDMIRILKDYEQNELADKLLITYQEKIQNNPEYLKQHLQQQVVSTETAINFLNQNQDPKSQIIILQLIQELSDIDFSQIISNLLDINVSDQNVIESLVKLNQHMNQQQKEKLITLIQSSNGDDFTKLQQLTLMSSQKSLNKIVCQQVIDKSKKIVKQVIGLLTTYLFVEDTRINWMKSMNWLKLI